MRTHQPNVAKSSKPTNPLRRTCLALLVLATLAFAPRAQQPGPFGIQARFDGTCLVVQDVTRGSLAAKSGVLVGDRIAGGIDAAGRRSAIQNLGGAGFAALLRSARFSLIVYRANGKRPLEIKVQRAATAAPQAADRPVSGGVGRKQTLVLRPQKITDAGMDGMVSHTVLVPRGWRFQGGVRWTDHPRNFTHFVGRLESPAGASLNSDYIRSFEYGERTSTGTELTRGATRMAPPRQVGAIATQVILRAIRPGAKNVSMIRASRNPEAEAKVGEMLAWRVRAEAKQNAFYRTQRWMGRFESKIWHRVETVRVTYEEAGRQWEEQLVYTVVGQHHIQGVKQGGYWDIHHTLTARAPKGQLDSQVATLFGLARCVRPEPRWAIALQQLQQKIQKIQHDTNMMIIRSYGKRARIRANANAEISDMQMSSWRKQQASSDRVHRAVVNSIRGVDDYRTGDGTTIAVGSGYDRVFTDALGNVVMTNDPSFDPNAMRGSWQQLQRVDYFNK